MSRQLTETPKVPRSTCLAFALATLVAGCDHPLPPAEAPPPAATAGPEPVTTTPRAPTPEPEPPDPVKPPGINLDEAVPSLAADPDIPERYPPGVVSKDLLTALSEGDSEHDPKPPLAHAEPCAQRLRTDPATPSGCAWGANTIAAFHATDEKVAFIDTDETHDDRGSCSGLVGVIMSMGKPRASEVKVLIPKSKDVCPSGSTVPWGVSELLARLAKEGYVDPRPLVKKRGRVPFGVWSYRPIAALRAPLRGYLLVANEEQGGTKVTVDLVTPDNKTRHRLGSTPLLARSCVDRNAKGTCVKTSTSQQPSVIEASLSPDGKHLVVLLMLNTPAPHDTTESFVRNVFAMPKGVAVTP